MAPSRTTGTPRAWRAILAVAATLVCCLPGTTSAEQRAGPKRLRLTDSIALPYSQGWREVERFTNGAELVKASAKRPNVIDARLQVTAEVRGNHADAVKRLGEIAAEHGDAARFVVVSGWPGMSRQRTAPLPRTGEQAAERENPLEPPEIATFVTVAIAVDETLVRFEATYWPHAEARGVDEIEGLARSLAPRKSGDPKKAAAEIDRLKRALPKVKKTSAPAPAREEAARALPADLNAGAPVLVQGGVGELEVAVSNDGQNVVVAANSGFSNSTNGGSSFTARGGLNPGFGADGDPSLAFGQSGAFYWGFIGFPNGTCCGGGVTGCTTSLAVSTNNGTGFVWRSHAVFCPNTGNICFPDQPHIAADRRNASPSGDQVYAVWRNFTSATATSCFIGQGFVSPRITCSLDGGRNWTATQVVGTGDFPRVSVGPDGFVYVVFLSGGQVMLNKFGSCASGLNPQPGFPVVVTPSNGVTCPMPGLDRCNDGNTLASPMVAVDDTDANHVYVALAATSACATPGTAAGQQACNDDVTVFDSVNGGLTFARSAVVNSATIGRRFMPWVCATQGMAMVSWYDRRAGAAAGANDDLTAYFAASVGVLNNSLKAGQEVNVSGTSDPECATGWPCGERSSLDAATCTQAQPQAGRCSGSGIACDFNAPVCPAGQTCNAFGGGCPKYGDYNGNACAGGRIFTAWASATAPTGLPAPGQITVYSSTLQAPPPTCAPGLTNCSNLCVNLATNGHNCGSCGNDCADDGPAFICRNGRCQCPPGTRPCCGGDLCRAVCPKFCP